MIRTGEIPVHYGKEYLKYAASSIAPFCNKVVVLYTNRPSYGHGSNESPLESEEELRACCDGISNLIWHRGQWGSESAHRNAVFDVVPDTDLVIRADADEVWMPDALEQAIRETERSPARNFLVGGFRHFYRSFGFACKDAWNPVRLVKPAGAGDTILHLPLSVMHFGYAIRPEAMAYKWRIHGHKTELRSNWLDNIWGKNVRQDCHPTMSGGWWNAEAYDRVLLPSNLCDHPYFEKEIIE